MKFIKITLALLFSALSALSMAGDIKPYNQAEFDQLTAAGKPVVLAIHATWCPTCKAQAPIQSKLMGSPAYKDYTLFTIDFDADKPVLKKFKVTTQSTMIAFKGRTEVGRSVGDTNGESIEALIKKAHT